MAALLEICKYCDDLLKIKDIKDFNGALNGLQIENCGHVHKIGAAVDANFAAIELAIENKIDLLLVHHGLFWSHERRLIGQRYRIYQKILANNLAIYSAHLPLDCHNEIGNNAIIAKKLNLIPIGSFGSFEGSSIGIVTNGTISLKELKSRLKIIFPGLIHELNFGPSMPKKIGILSGSGGNDVLYEAITQEIDTIITGEIRYSTCSLAQELCLNIFACGHYNTEVFGVKALAESVSENFKIQVQFLNVPFDV